MAWRPMRAARISVHEAGHCVAARLLGLSAGEASIIEPGAHAVFDCDCGAPSIVALLAGSVAESLAFGDYDAHGGSVDWRNAWERLEHLGYEDGQALWDYTHDLLRPYTGLVKLVAAKLERARLLDGGELDRLILRG